MTDWAPGDRARCVDAWWPAHIKELLGPCPLKLGEVYLVTGVNGPSTCICPDGERRLDYALALLNVPHPCDSSPLFTSELSGWASHRFVKEEPLVDEESEMLEAVIGGVGPARMETVE